MNTFCIKSRRSDLKGKRIGQSEKDGQYVYVYRSHQVFKELNPDIYEQCKKGYDDAYTVLGKYRKNKEINSIYDEFDFKKNNICPACGGLKYFYHIKTDKPINGNIVEDEDGFTIFDEEISVYCVCDDGTYIGSLEHDLRMEKRQTEDARKDYQKLKDYILKTSTCKTCEGHQERIFGLCTCKECGLPGNGYWPG
jgi:hypothetical protein